MAKAKRLVTFWSRSDQATSAASGVSVGDEGANEGVCWADGV